jgi:hypothetical protein
MAKRGGGKPTSNREEILTEQFNLRLTKAEDDYIRFIAAAGEMYGASRADVVRALIRLSMAQAAKNPSRATIPELREWLSGQMDTYQETEQI